MKSGLFALLSGISAIFDLLGLVSFGKKKTDPTCAQLIEQIRQVTQGAARLLVTLARRGKAIERDDPERAAFLLAAVATHPLYKGGRLTFDMLEVEDLMLSNSSVDLATTRDVIHVLNSGNYHLVEMLRQLGYPTQASPIREGDRVGGPVPAPAQNGDEPTAVALLPRVSLGPGDDVAGAANAWAARDGDGGASENVPELRSSDYLYDYVVLGLLDARIRPANPSSRTSEQPRSYPIGRTSRAESRAPQNRYRRVERAWARAMQ